MEFKDCKTNRHYNLKPVGFYNSAWYKDLKKYCKNKGVNVLGNY